MTALAVRLPPRSPDAEISTLGAILLRNDALDDVGGLVSAEDFYQERHRLVFRACCDLYGEGRAIDTVTLHAALKSSGLLEQAGGPDYIAKLAEAVPTAVNAVQYARIVRHKALLRRYIGKATDLLEEAYGEPADAEEFVARAEAAVAELQQGGTDKEPIHARELLKGSFAELEERMRSGREITGVPTGFTDLDRLTCGLQPKDLLILAARPSMGKTALGLQIAFNAAQRSEAVADADPPPPVAVFSLEMGGEQLVLRLLSSLANVPSDRIRRGNLGEQDFDALFLAADQISRSRLWIDDTPALPIAQLRAKVRRLQRAQGGIGLVVVDYLQLMRAPGNDSREQEVSEISRSLKALAKEMGVPVLALAQLNRDVEKRRNRRPQLADLRESGAIEQDADLVAFIYRDEVYNPNTKDKGIAEVIVAKQRNGAVGTVKLSFQANYTRFGNLTQQYTGGW